MNPELPSREQIEERITALLLGELPAAEAELLRWTISQDATLQKLHDELKSTIVLVREAVKPAAATVAEKTEPPKLSDERRQKLLAQFKTPRPKPAIWLRPLKLPALRTLVVTACVIVFILGLAAISIPNFVKARSTSQANAVINNLRQIDGAKQQWALEKNKSANDTPTTEDLTPYLTRGAIPKSVTGEQYVLGKVSESAGAVEANGKQVNQLKSLGLASRMWGADNSDRAALASPPEQTVGSLTIVASPPPDSAPPTVTLGARTALSAQLNGAELADNAVRAPSAQIVLPSTESTPEVAAQSEKPTTAGEGGVFSQHIVGYVNVAKVEDSANLNSGSISGFAQNREVVHGTGGAGGGGGFGGSGVGSLGDLAANQSTASGNFSPLAGLPVDSTDKLGVESPPPAHNPAPAQTLTWSDSGVNQSQAQNQPATPALVLNESPVEESVSRKAQTVNSDQLLTSGLRSRRNVTGKDSAGGGAARYEGYWIPSQPENVDKVPVAGDAPVLGRAFQSSTPASAIAAPVTSPPTAALEANSALADTTIANADGLALGVAKDSFQTGLPKEDAVALRYLATTNAVALNQGALSSGFSATPTMDAQQLQMINGNTEAKKSQLYEAAKSELEQKKRIQEFVYSKLEAEKMDLELPKTSMVQVTDRAEPPKSQTAWQKLTGEYESTARIKVENDVTDIAGTANAGSYQAYDPYFVQTTLETIRSDAVLGKVVDSLKLDSAWSKKDGGDKLTKKEAINLLRKRLDLNQVKNTKLIAVGATSGDPNEAADLANAVAKAYSEYRFENRRQMTEGGLEKLEEEYAQQAKDIQLAAEKVERLRKTLNPEQVQSVKVDVPKVDLPVRKPPTNAPVPQPEILTRENAFSTFSLNVSDVSFKLAAASLEKGQMPDAASIRSEEFINAFDYHDPEAKWDSASSLSAPAGKLPAPQPVAFASERARYPFAHNRDLLRFSVKTAAAGRQAGRALNLVLLLDTSGSMERADRVAVVREALRVLASQLQPQDIVSVVTFARTPRLWADGISGDKAGETLDRIGSITPDGGTNLEEAMRLAYETARRHYLANGMNRVVLLTDGAANLGNVDPGALKQKVEAQRRQGIALDCFGIGWEDFNDDLLEQLSGNGDGRYAFINSPEEAGSEFAAKLAGALQVAAQDVKVQVEFNPQRVISWRQIGYAKHQLTKEQFRDNSVIAAEIAAQEAGNALYTVETKPDGIGPIATLRVRYRVPNTQDFYERSWNVDFTGTAPALEQSSPAMRLAATAAAFSEWLAASPFAQDVTPDELLKDLSGVPEVYGADSRPMKLEWMIRQAKSVSGK